MLITPYLMLMNMLMNMLIEEHVYCTDNIRLSSNRLSVDPLSATLIIGDTDYRR